MKVCPTNVIQPAVFDAGLEGFFTPQMDYRRAYCDWNCNECGKVCPTQAIRELTPRGEAAQGHRPRVHRPEHLHPLGGRARLPGVPGALPHAREGHRVRDGKRGRAGQRRLQAGRRRRRAARRRQAPARRARALHRVRHLPVQLPGGERGGHPGPVDGANRSHVTVASGVLRFRCAGFTLAQGGVVSETGSGLRGRDR